MATRLIRINRHARANQARTCKQCGNQFLYDAMRKRPLRVFCSRECKRLHAMEYQKEYQRRYIKLQREVRESSRIVGTCKRCKELFARERRQQVYCSAKCRKADSWQKEKLRKYRQSIASTESIASV